MAGVLTSSAFPQPQFRCCSCSWRKCNLRCGSTKTQAQKDHLLLLILPTRIRLIIRPNNLLPIVSSLRTPTATSSSSTANTESESEDDPPQPPPKSEPDSDFEARLDRIRIRYRSGQGKKAELRKARKSSAASSSSSKASSKSSQTLFLPAVPLKEAVSEGLKVEFGFSLFSERVNGRVAALGLSALLLVELATGKTLISFHAPPIVFLQLYFVTAVSAVYLKFLKEKVSVWPPPSSPSSSSP